MTISDDVPKTRLKIKFSFKDADLLLNSGSSEVREQPFRTEDCARNVSVNGNRGSMMKKSHKAAPHAPDSLILYGPDSSNLSSPVQSSRKRGPLRVIDSVMNKRQKMDRSLKQHCGSILEQLIKHPAALGFSEPVDPLKLNIPDYFSVVSSPMDLGTVRAKLQDNMYFSIEEFKDDVRLTFSNAMLYNPSDNFFNKNAKKLDSIFSTKLKSLDARLNRESMNHEQSCLSSGRVRKTTETKHLFHRRSSVHSGLAPMIKMSTEDKRKLTKEFVEATRPKMTENLMVLDARAANEEPARDTQNSRFPGDEILQKGTAIGYRSTSRAVKTMPLVNMVATGCRSCGSLKCHCYPQNDYSCASSRNLASERYTEQDCDGPTVEHESGLTSDACKSDPESDGAVSVFDDENICSSPQSSLGTSDATAEDWTTASDLQLSPKKALRAAMLKSRFVDTILKAKQKTLLDNVEKADPVKLRQQKEKLERQQKMEKAKIEAQIRAAEVASSLRAREELRIREQIRAAEVASSLRAREELRIRRERERDAARIALQKMEKTVEIDENLNILKEFDMFSGSMPSNHPVGSDKSLVPFEASQGGQLGNILEQLGLYMKDDCMDYEDEEEGLILHDREEGLVCS